MRSGSNVRPRLAPRFSVYEIKREYSSIAGHPEMQRPQRYERARSFKMRWASNSPFVARRQAFRLSTKTPPRGELPATNLPEVS
jgi:hypothetical protein